MNLNRKDFSALLGLTTRQIHNLEAEGIPHTVENGRKLYPMPDAAQWYYRRQMDREKAKMIPTGYDEAKTREMIARADMAEMDAAKARGELIHLDDLEAQHSAPLAQLRARLLSLPGRIVADLPMSATDALDIIEPIVHEMMKELSEDDGDFDTEDEE